MDTEKSILKKVAAAIYNGDFNSFEQTILPLLNFEDADENNAPTTSNPDLSMLLENFCDEDASYDENHLDLLEAPDPYFLCEWVDKTQDPSPCPDYDDWEWDYSPDLGTYLFADFGDEDSCKHYDLICTLFEKYEGKYLAVKQQEWLKAFYDEILYQLNEKNVLFYPDTHFLLHADSDVDQFLDFLPRAKEIQPKHFDGMLSRSEYKFLLQTKLSYKKALRDFKQTELYRNAVMLGLNSQALTAFDDTFTAQYPPDSVDIVDIASENNAIGKIAAALKSFDNVSTTIITTSDLPDYFCSLSYPSLDEIAQWKVTDHTIAERLSDAPLLFDTYEISASPMEFMCLEEVLSHFPYKPEQILDGIQLCCDQHRLYTVDEILSQLACNLCDYLPYDEKYCDKDGAYEDIGFHFVESTDLEKALNQFHATAHFDYISFGRQLAGNNAYCVGEYGYIPHHARAQRFHACQFSKTDVCTLGLYAAGLLEKYSSLVSSDDKLSPIPTPALASSLLQRFEECGITLENVPDYEPYITTKQEEKRPFDLHILDNVVCAYKPPEERKNSTLAEDLQAAQVAANRQQQQAAPKAQSHNQKL